MAFTAKKTVTEEPTIAIEMDQEGAPSADGSNLPNIDGNALAEAAKALGSRVSQETEAAIATVSQAKEDWQGGPFTALLRLKQDFSDEELSDLFAQPDTDAGSNPDRFKISKEVGNKTKLVAANFYRLFAEGTPAGQNYLSRIEWCERVRDPKAMKDDVPDDIRNMNPDELDTHQSWCETRIKTMTASYKSALALHFKAEEVSTYPGITCEPLWVKGKEGEEVQKVPEPIQIYITPEPGKPVAKYKFMSIKNFLKLDVKKALEKGGTFLNLIESGVTPKAKGDGGNGNAAEGFVIKTADKALDTVAEFHRWVDEILNDKNLVEYGKLLKKMNEKDNDETIVQVVELANFFNKLVSDTHAGDKYVKLQAGGSDLVSTVIKSAA